MIKQGYSSRQYKEVFKDRGTILDDSYPPLIQVGPTLYSIYPFSTKTITRVPFACTYKNQGLVAGVFVTDPLSPDYNQKTGYFTSDYNFCLESMSEIEGVTVKPYKTHAIVDLQSYDSSKLPENHRRNIKKASTGGYHHGDRDWLSVEVCTIPQHYSKLVMSLYSNLKDRHTISSDSWTNYSLEQIEILLIVPGAVLFKTVRHDGMFGQSVEIVNYSLFYIDGNNVYYHLSCQSDTGYKMNSNFLMMDTAIKFFKGLGLNKLELGGAADGTSGEGLWRFKKGFANETKQNHIIKVIYDKDHYNGMCEGKEDNGRFPAYL